MFHRTSFGFPTSAFEPTKFLRDASTQYSSSYLTDKEIDIQRSSLLKNCMAYHDKFSRPGPSSPSTTSSTSFSYRPSEMSDSLCPQSSTASTTTQYSSTLLSSSYDNASCSSQYNNVTIVPFNSPCSDAEIVETKNDRNILDITYNPRQVKNVTLTYNKPLTEVNEQNQKPDKTLTLLNDASYKLAALAYRINSTETDEIIKAPRKNLSQNNPLNSTTTKQANYHLEQENKRRCFEDNDEYYEKQRRDVRQYFEGKNNLPPYSGAKKNFDLYLSGDDSKKINQDFDVFIGSDILKNKSKEKSSLIRDSMICNLNSINDKLNKELSDLQRTYDNMCLRLDLQAKKVDSLNFDRTEEPKLKKADKELIKERQETYLTVENDIKRVIEELLKESGDIKDAAILNGAKEESEPPFSWECLINKIDPSLISAKEEPEPPCSWECFLKEIDPSFIMCTTILNNILNSSFAFPENEDENKRLYKEMQYILDMLLDGIFKEHNNAEASNSNEILEAISLLFEPKEECSNLHIGDVNCLNKKISSDYKEPDINQHIVYFCNATTFASKIPKTSYSFGEVSSKNILNSNFEAQAKPRDGLTITGLEQSSRNTETSRLFNELLNLQSASSCVQIKNEENASLSNEYHSAHVIKSESQHFLDATENLIDEDAFSLGKQDSFVSTLNVNIYDSSEQNEEVNSNSETPQNSNNSTPVYQTTNEDERVDQRQVAQFLFANTNKIGKSQKSFKLNITQVLPSNQPSTSIKIYKETRATDEEEIITALDSGEEILISSTEPEEMLLPPTSRKACPDSLGLGRNIAYTSSEEEEEDLHPSVRKFPKTIKKDEIIEIKPSTSIVSNSDSILVDIKPCCSNETESGSGSTYFSVKPTKAMSNIQKMFKINTEEGQPSESEYEGDNETVQIKLPGTKQRYKSKHELNTPQEIADIEKNVEANNQLTRSSSIVLSHSDTASELNYEESSSSSQAESESHLYLRSRSSREIMTINIENSEEKPKVKPSQST